MAFKVNILDIMDDNFFIVIIIFNYFLANCHACASLEPSNS